MTGGNMFVSKKSNWIRTIIYAVLIMAFFALGGWFLTTRSWKFLPEDNPLKIVLHASSEADYSQVLKPGEVAPIELAIIEEVIKDDNPSPAELSIRIIQIQENLDKPVPTITPQAQSNITEITPTLILTADTEQPPATNTQTLESITPSITIQLSTTLDSTQSTETAAVPNPSFTKTNTPIPASSTQTNPPTSIPPSRTNTITAPTLTSVPASETSPAPTNTQIPPTNTPVPTTATSAPPTSTQAPPTSTPNICSQISLAYYSTIVRHSVWRIQNSSGTSPIISRIAISWPSSNDDLDRIYYQGESIWNGNVNPPEADINSGWSGDAGRRTVTPSSNSYLSFRFDNLANFSGYTIKVYLSNSCTISANR